MSRTKSLKLNALANLFNEFVTFVIGMILPRLILLAYGSSTNGLVSSVTQFLSFSALLRTGLDAVTQAALYKPLAENNTGQISSIMVATNNFMHKVSTILLCCIVAFAVIYPLMITGQFPYLYTVAMVLVLSISTFAVDMFGRKNMILLSADQKMYVYTIINVISNIVSYAISILLIELKLKLELDFDIIFIKLAAAIAFLLNPILLEVYVRKHYKLNYKAPANNLAIKNRWDAFFQQVAAIMNLRIDVILITLFQPLAMVSVYTVHNMVATNMCFLVRAPINGVTAAFGNIMAKNEYDNLRITFRFIEWALFALATFAFSVTGIMLSPFVMVYTRSVTDIEYFQPLFSFLLSFTTYCGCLRVPYQMIVEASGHFKEMKKGALFEVVVNLLVSIALMPWLGLIGVIIGTLVGCIIRTWQYSRYALKHILDFSILHAVKQYAVYATVFLLNSFAGKLLIRDVPSSYVEWIMQAIPVGLICLATVTVASLIFNGREVAYLWGRIKKKYAIANK